jgi:hypothetical protein
MTWIVRDVRDVQKEKICTSGLATVRDVRDLDFW